jgi:hypothetical protein
MHARRIGTGTGLQRQCDSPIIDAHVPLQDVDFKAQRATGFGRVQLKRDHQIERLADPGGTLGPPDRQCVGLEREPE